MKKAIPYIVAAILGMMMFSCTNSHKNCAAYAKHETSSTVTYDDVQ